MKGCWMYEQIKDEWMARCWMVFDGKMYGWMERWMDEQMDGWRTGLRQKKKTSS